jgi:site-specific DNA-adenine methylase
MDKLKHPEYRAHLERITFVENMYFGDVVKKYDSPTTYFYMDPPYWKTENYYSNHDFDRDDHERLANILKGVKGKFALSYYEFKQLREWFPEEEFGVDKNGQMMMFQPTKYKWARETFKKAAAAKKDGTQNEGIELLIMNY